MKRILMKKRFVMMAFLLGMMAFGFGVTGLSAQQVSDDTEWKLPGDATAALTQAIDLMDQEMQINPNELLDFKRKFYYSIATAIEEGQIVPVALDQSYAMFVPASGPTVFNVELIPNSLPLSTWQTYYQNAAQLLQL